MPSLRFAEAGLGILTAAGLSKPEAAGTFRLLFMLNALDPVAAVAPACHPVLPGIGG